MTRDQRYNRGPHTSVTDLQRVDMARELMETAKEMQVQGLKRILGETIKNPLIPKAAREHAERAYAIACMLEQDLEWRSEEFKLWMRLKGYALEGGAQMPKGTCADIPDYVKHASGVRVPTPAYIRATPQNLRRALDFEIAQVGMISGQLVYEDIIAETTVQKRPLGGVLRDGRPAETSDPEETQS